MSEDRLVLNTKKSLYDPIEIEIDEKVYKSLKTTNAVLKEINKLDAEVEKDSGSESLYKAVQLLFDIDMKILEELDRREVQDIYTFSKRKFLEIEKQRLDLVTKTFAGIQGPGRQKVKGLVPNEKRSGSKR